MVAYDDICMCGQDAKAELMELLEKRGIETYYSLLKPKEFELYLEVCREVLKRWKTTTKFSVGDKVYVKRHKSTMFRNCIRGTIIEIGTDGWGYRLKAFQQDLPGIYMFNIWDKDLLPRTSKGNKEV